MIYEGRNPDTDKPIIKVFLNPLMNWIWIGVLIVVVGTLLALVPNLTRSAGAGRGGGWRCWWRLRFIMLRRVDAGGCGLCAGGGDAGGGCLRRGSIRLGTDDLRLRVRADAAGVQPCGVS